MWTMLRRPGNFVRGLKYRSYTAQAIIYTNERFNSIHTFENEVESVRVLDRALKTPDWTIIGMQAGQRSVAAC